MNDTAQLNEGMVVKNYGEMCKLLGEDVKGGDSKKAQLKEWERYFEFTREKYKFIIKQVYDTPALKQQGNARYVRILERLVNHELYSHDYRTNIFIKKALFLTTGMTNANYKKEHSYPESTKTTEITKMELWHYKNFYSRSNTILSEILFNTLNSMQKRNLLKYSRDYDVVKVVNSNDSFYKVSHSASKNEIEQIKAVEKEALVKLEWKTINPYKIEEYYSTVNGLLREYYDWDSVYKMITISPNKELLSEEIELITDSEELLNMKHLLNETIIEAVNNNAQFCYDKNLNKIISQQHIRIGNAEEIVRNQYDQGLIKDYLFPADYIEIQKFLTERLLRVK